MSAAGSVFPELKKVREAARRALGDVHPIADPGRHAFYGERTDAGRSLPEPYLVHFLLVDLLGFPSLGQEEKVAWTVPVEFQGQTFVIQHRKMGLGVFARDAKTENAAARDIVIRVEKGVKAARPFFDWLASEAVAKSRVNLINRAPALYSRFDFFLRMYREKRAQGQAHEAQKEFMARWQAVEEARWLALASIDAFFSWTEHVFVLLAVMLGRATSGLAVTKLAESDWPDKFRAVIGLEESTAKEFFDDLLEIRRELRNYMAHGAFGKDGRAFMFHSSAGAVPVLLPHKVGSRRFMVAGASYFEDEAALATISEFIGYLWSGARSPARLYIQESGLDLILTRHHEFSFAMQSDAAMQQLVDRRHYEIDRAANMDW